MKVRFYRPEDREPIREIHAAQGLDYQFPDLDGPEFVVRAVIEHPNGRLTGLFLRKTAEAFLMMDADHAGRKAKLGELLVLSREIPPLAKRQGFTDVYCNIPPEIERKFGRLLLHTGWEKNLWPQYTLRLR